MAIGGKLVAFFGPDGTGKSTTASLVEEICADQGLTTYRYHWRPRVLPSLKSSNNASVDNTRPDELATRSWAVSFFNYVYFFLDFVLAYWIVFRPILNSGGIVIYERYYYDVLFHPRRYKLERINALGFVLAKLVPKPDTILLMHGDPQTIFCRKPELTIDQISAQQDQMSQMLVKFGDVTFIDVSQNTKKECAHQAFSAFCPNSNSQKR